MRLYPFAMDQASFCTITFQTSTLSLLALLETFKFSNKHTSTLRNKKVWGCPAHVLDPKLQDGKKLPKQDPHTRQGQCLEKSMAHASSVGLIRNLRTGRTCPLTFTWFMKFHFKQSWGYEENDALTEYMQSSLIQGKEDNTENVIGQSGLENTTIPLVNTYWINSAELDKRKSDQVNEEVNIRVREEQVLIPMMTSRTKHVRHHVLHYHYIWNQPLHQCSRNYLLQYLCYIIIK